MSRRYLVPLALGALLLGGVPALADANGSTEVKSVERACDAPADNRYSAPKADDCRNADGSFNPNKKYTSQYHSNDVKCGDKNSPTPANPTGIRAYGRADQAGQNGGAGICSDGSGAAPGVIQGRAGAEGGNGQGYKVFVDGDKDNSNETAQGYAVVEGGTAGPPAVRCGKAHSQGGRANTDSMQAHDNQSECG